MNDLANVPSPGLGEAAELVRRELQQPPLTATSVALAAVLIDVPILAAALWFAQFAAQAPGFSPIGAAGLALLAALAVAMILLVTSSYRPQRLRHPLRSMGRLAAAAMVPIGLLVLFAEAHPSGLLLAALLALTVSGVPLRLGAAVVAGWICKMRLLDRRAVIAGGGENALTLIRALNRQTENDVRIFGIFDDRDDSRSPLQVSGIPKLGTYRDLVTFARQSEIDMVIISLPLEAERRIAWLLEALRVLPVEVRLSAYSQDYAFLETGRYPLVSAIRHSFAPDCRLTKRLLDITLASLALVLLAPVMLLAALAIRLESPGPIFFRQKRHGYNDRVIEVVKFRSMYHHLADPEARIIVTKGDARITRVGRLLRRTSIDELPQLFNVLRGDLSLVGPRPHAIDAVSSQNERFARIVDGYSARHRLPPGITGWAQVNGWRGEIDDPEKLQGRFEHDLYYIENWSIWLDLKILLRTPLSLLDGRSAY